MEKIEQNLIELIADFLDNESHQLDELIAGVKDPKDRGETDLHIKMAEAAFAVYKSTIIKR